MRRSLILAGILVGLTVVAYAIGIERATSTFEVVKVSATNAAATCLTASSYSSIKQGRVEVCWKANWSDTNIKAYVDSFATVDEANYGWPIVGTEKECHDWDVNVPLCFWAEDGEGPLELRVLGAK